MGELFNSSDLTQWESSGNWEMKSDRQKAVENETNSIWLITEPKIIKLCLEVAKILSKKKLNPKNWFWKLIQKLTFSPLDIIKHFWPSFYSVLKHSNNVLRGFIRSFVQGFNRKVCILIILKIFHIILRDTLDFLQEDVGRVSVINSV